jgi:hypothetical protein
MSKMKNQDSISRSFDLDVACNVGVEEAILLHNISFWCSHNEMNRRNFYENRYWTYNSAEAFSKQFPFWNAKKIDRMLDKLVQEGYIVISNFNSSKFDRTRWFSVTNNFEKSIPQKREMEKTWMGKAKDEKGESYTDRDQIENTNEEHSLSLEEFKPMFEHFRLMYKGTKRGLDTEFKNFVSKNKDWKEVCPLLKEAYKKQLDKREDDVRNNRFVPEHANLCTYINQRRWEIVVEETEKKQEPKRYTDQSTNVW